MRRFFLLLGLAFGLGSLAVPRAGAQPDEVTLRVIGWNMQSDFTTKKKESNPDFLAKQIAAKKGVQIWGLCEVLDDKTFNKFIAGAKKTGGDYAGVLGKTGNRDKMGIIYDKKRLELLGTEELKLIQINSGLRAPFVGKFKGKTTGQQFLFVVNHLARGDDDARLQQCKMLNQWAKTQTLPVVMVGDYNIDFDVKKGDAGKRDPGFDELLKDNRFIWVRPQQLVKTQASNQFNSVLDFVFVANVPFHWSAESRILNRENDEEAIDNDFDDDAQSTDHRPVDAVLTFRPPGGGGGRSREEIVKEIADLKKRIEDLEEQLKKVKP